MRNIIAILLVTITIFAFSGCFILREREQVYHDNVNELEKYIIDELGDYIIINGFDPDVYYDPSSRYKGKLAEWNVSFRRQYIYDEAQIEQISPVSIVERVRELYNQYVDSHEDYYLDGYVVEIEFDILDKSNPSYTRYAVISNWDIENYCASGRKLTTVCMHSPKYNDAYSFPFGDWDYYYKNGGIDVAQMDENSTMDQIIEVADNMPNLKYIAVKNQAVADEASKLRPNVKFVGLLGN